MIPPTSPNPPALSKMFVEMAIAIMKMITMVECPSEKNKPQVTGTCPSCISPRVALSIALEWVIEIRIRMLGDTSSIQYLMWSASSAVIIHD